MMAELGLISGRQASIPTKTHVGVEDKRREDARRRSLPSQLIRTCPDWWFTRRVWSQVQAYRFYLQAFRRLWPGNWNGNHRYQFDAQISSQDMMEYYIPPFQSCARDSKGVLSCALTTLSMVCQHARTRICFRRSWETIRTGPASNNGWRAIVMRFKIFLYLTNTLQHVNRWLRMFLMPVPMSIAELTLKTTYLLLSSKDCLISLLLTRLWSGNIYPWSDLDTLTLPQSSVTANLHLAISAPHLLKLLRAVLQ